MSSKHVLILRPWREGDEELVVPGSDHAKFKVDQALVVVTQEERVATIAYGAEPGHLFALWMALGEGLLQKEGLPEGHRYIIEELIAAAQAACTCETPEGVTRH